MTEYSSICLCTRREACCAVHKRARACTRLRWLAGGGDGLLEENNAAIHGACSSDWLVAAIELAVRETRGSRMGGFSNGHG